MNEMVAGIDVHKRVLMAVVGTASGSGKPGRFERRRFGATSLEISNLSRWLVEHGVQEVVMESTAQYWKPVWLALEGPAILSGNQGRYLPEHRGVFS